MITFSCSCGKKYQLPDRLAGREVRCNQCGSALIIPMPEQSETIESTTDTVTSTTEPKNKNTIWGNIPLPNGEKNEQSPIVAGWTTGPYQKGSSCMLTIVLVLLGAGSAFFAGFLSGNLLHRNKPTHYDEQSEYAETDHNEEETENANNIITKFSVADLKIDENFFPLFAVQTADNGQIQISLDHHPPVTDEKNKTTLDDIADALGTDAKPKELPEHNQTLQIHSESNSEFRLVFPSLGLMNRDAKKIKEIQFSLYIPDKTNTVFKPVKPEGVDKILILSDLRLRIVMEIGFIEFVPENKEKFVSILEHAQSDWVPVQIPISGNEIWKRIDHGLFGSRTTVMNIELHAQPTGNGVTLWIDNLKIEE
jgi:hypothetical protein